MTTLLRRSPILAWGLALVLALALAGLAASWLAPAAPDEQLDPAAAQYLPPGSHRLLLRLVNGRTLLAESVRTDPSGVEFQRLGRTEILPASALAAPPSRRSFLLGTDGFSRDLLSRLLYGARVSLAVAVLALALALTAGVLVGAAAATSSWIDSVLMRTTDALLCFPHLILALAAAAFLAPRTWVLIAILGGTSWMGVARLVRAELRALQRREFALAARASGIHPARILWRHLLPNALSPVVVDATLRIGDLILVEAALSFLGLGVQPPTASWGNMVADGRDVLQSAWWVAAFPGAVIALAVVAFNLIGDGLRDTLDPRV